MHAIIPFIWPWWNRLMGQWKGWYEKWVSRAKWTVNQSCVWLAVKNFTSMTQSTLFLFSLFPSPPSLPIITHQPPDKWAFSPAVIRSPYRASWILSSGVRESGLRESKNHFSGDWGHGAAANGSSAEAFGSSLQGHIEKTWVWQDHFVGIVNLQLYLRTQWLVVEVSISSICRVKPYKNRVMRG